MPRPRTILVVLLLAPVALYAAMVGGLALGQDRLLYPGAFGMAPGLAAYATAGSQEVSVAVEGGLVLRGLHREAGPGQPTFVVFHGNGGHDARKLHVFADRGWGTLIVPHRGFSGNPGRPSQAALIDDAGRVLDVATGPLGLQPGRIVLYGESLGSGVAIRVAAKGAWRAVVLEAPFATVEDRAAELFSWLPVRRLLRDRWRSVDHVGEVERPLLILHGDADEIMPIAHGRRLFDAATEPKRAVWMRGGGHQLPPERVADEIAEFLADH